LPSFVVLAAPSCNPLEKAMSTETYPTAENEAVLKKVEALEQEIAALKSAISRGRVVRLLLLVMILALICAAVWTFYRLALEFGSRENLNLLAERARIRLNASADPAMKELHALVNSCTPVVTTAFRERAEADMPKYTEALAAERDVMVTNLQTRLQEKVNDRYRQTEEKFQAILQEEFPEADDPELIVQTYTSIEQILEKLIQKYYSDELEREVEELSLTWEDFEMAELPGEDEVSLEQQLMAGLLRLASLRLESKSELDSELKPELDSESTPQPESEM
jgi:hypothetical protein